MNLDQITAAYGHANAKAWLRLIRERESSQDDSAYTVVNGGTHFSAPPWRHPWHGIPTTQGARASGAYQFLGTTWSRVADALGFGDDFQPINQDLGALYLTAGRGALDDVLRGDVASACAKCRQEWTSLPGAAEASSGWTVDKAIEVFKHWGGTVAVEEAPVEVSQGKDMGAGLILGLVQTALQAFAPLAQQKIQGELARHTDTDTAGAVAQNVMDAIKQATGKADPIEAVVALKSAPKDSPVVQAAQDDALARLDRLAPVFDKLAALDEKQWAAGIAAKDAARARATGDTYDVAPVMVQNVTMTSNWLLAGLVAAVLVSIILKAMFPQLPDYVPMILPALMLLAGQISKERGAIIAYRFDGTPASNAANAINAEIAQSK